jgi:hypothetical protein
MKIIEIAEINLNLLKYEKQLNIIFTSKKFNVRILWNFLTLNILNIQMKNQKNDILPTFINHKLSRMKRLLKINKI